jgi:hypothetical protein
LKKLGGGIRIRPFIIDLRSLMPSVSVSKSMHTPIVHLILTVRYY